MKRLLIISFFPCILILFGFNNQKKEEIVAISISKEKYYKWDQKEKEYLYHFESGKLYYRKNSAKEFKEKDRKYRSEFLFSKDSVLFLKQYLDELPISDYFADNKTCFYITYHYQFKNKYFPKAKYAESYRIFGYRPKAGMKSKELCRLLNRLKEEYKKQ